MRARRAFVIVAVAAAIAAVAAFEVPAIRDRVAPRATRLIAFLFVDLFTKRGTWTEGHAAPSTKMEAQSAVVGGKLYVFGGFAGTNKDTMSPVEPRVSVYDPRTDAWSRAADMPIDVTHCNAVVVDRTGALVGPPAAEDGPDRPAPTHSPAAP